MCEISLRDKIYKSLHGKKFVFYCCSEIMTNNYAINQLIPDCLKIYFNVRHFFFFFTLTFLKYVVGQTVNLPGHKLELGSHPFGFHCGFFNSFAFSFNFSSFSFNSFSFSSNSLSLSFSFNSSSFNCNLFSFPSISFLFSSISMAARHDLISCSSSGDSCKNE